MHTTPNRQYNVPDLGDSPNVPAYMDLLANNIDTDVQQLADDVEDLAAIERRVAILEGNFNAGVTSSETIAPDPEDGHVVLLRLTFTLPVDMRLTVWCYGDVWAQGNSAGVMAIRNGASVDSNVLTSRRWHTHAMGDYQRIDTSVPLMTRQSFLAGQHTLTLTGNREGTAAACTYMNPEIRVMQ